MEELKNEINKAKLEVSNVAEENSKLQKDLIVFREHAFRISNTLNSDNSKIKKKEKVILESLSHRVQELEVIICFIY